MNFEPEIFQQNFDRQPFGFTHNLSSLDLFGIDSLVELAHKFKDNPRDYFMAASAPTPGTAFKDVPVAKSLPHQAIEHLDESPCRILLKRPEDHDPRFRDLLDEVFGQVVELRGGLGEEHLVRLEGGIFISSSATTTPFHFDPEINFFSQVAGEKKYHVFRPDVVTEPELENFYRRNTVEIGQIAFENRDAEAEHVFLLSPGEGLHQPQNAPHWVETGASRSVSYTFVFETDQTRARGRARAFNHYQRLIGLTPSQPGNSPALDAAKAEAMRLAFPLRRLVGRSLRASTMR